MLEFQQTRSGVSDRVQAAGHVSPRGAVTSSPRSGRLGRPLDAGVAADFGQRLGTDLSAVRVHTDDHAAASALRLGAAAYTDGTDIVFARGHYDPDTGFGRRLLAHELAHVVQMRGSTQSCRVGSTSSPTGDHEIAANRLADVALAGLQVPATLIQPRQAGSAVAMQKKPDPFDVLRVDKPITGPQAEDMLKQYSTLDSAGKDGVIRAFARVGFAESPLRRWLAALPVASRRGYRAELSDIGERVQRLAVEQTSGKNLAQLGAAEAAFLLPEAEKEARAQVEEDAKKAGRPPPAAVSDADVAKAHAEATEKVSPIRPPEKQTAWDKVKAKGEDGAWNDRAKKAIAAVVAACKKVAPELGIVAANLEWAPDVIAKRGANVFALSGDPLKVGMSFVETAEADPAYCVRTVVHEIAGHPEFGSKYKSYEAEIFAEAHRQAPRLGETWNYGSEHTYGYIGTETYAALREVPYYRALSDADAKRGLVRAITPEENVANKVGLIKTLYPPEVGKAVVQGLYERFRVDPRITEDALALFESAVEQAFPGSLKGVPRRGPTWSLGVGAGAGVERAGGRSLVYTEVEANAVLKWTTNAISVGARLEVLPTGDKSAFVRAGLQSQVHVQLFRNLYGDLRGGYLWGFKGASSGITGGAGLSYDFGPVQMGLVYDFLKTADEKDPNAHRVLIRAGLEF